MIESILSRLKDYCAERKCETCQIQQSCFACMEEGVSLATFCEKALKEIDGYKDIRPRENALKKALEAIGADYHE